MRDFFDRLPKTQVNTYFLDIIGEDLSDLFVQHTHNTYPPI